jgi:hypothetical protein
MTGNARVRTFTAVVVLGAAGAVIAAPPPPPPPPMVDSNGVKSVTVPARIIPEPEERGKPYKVPATEWKPDPILWGWTCELPDGTGMTFGGVHQTNDDGIAHTQIKTADGWQPIVEELRKNNPLQARCEQVRALRNGCKDALARARHLYFEGKTADEEAKLIKASVDPAIEKVGKDLAKTLQDLDLFQGLDAYAVGQAKFAASHLKAAAGFLQPYGALVTPGQMATQRCAQIELEIAAEALDAEPPPRALSQIVYEPKHKVFVLFGGEHMDYSMNDLWVFDPARRRWFQRHPETAPEPRFDARIEALGDGRIAIRGGCVYEPGKHYIHVGPARWIYDLDKNTWTADGHTDKAFPADARSKRYGPPAGPENYMTGKRPDAAANEAKLKALPVNTWVGLKTPVALGGRDWATWVYDPDRDLFYVFAGGHVSYPGNDVARYHLATDRWEISDPIEIPLGCCGTNEQYPFGNNYNRRPWCRPHVWNGQAYDAGLKQMIMGSATDQKIDPYCYFYDPDRADWVGRLRCPPGMPNGCYSMQIRYTKHGMFSWNGAWLLDTKGTEWTQLKVQGKMPGGGVDSSGLVYDPKRDRMLFATLNGYARPFDGQIHALDMNTLQVTPLNPEGTNVLAKWSFFPREVTYYPDRDLFLWNERVNVGGKESPDLFVAYDAAGNRWVTIKLAIDKSCGLAFPSGVCSGIHWDAKRKLIWAGNSGYNGGVWVLRFDPATAEICPLKDFVPPPPPPPPPPQK